MTSSCTTFIWLMFMGFLGPDCTISLQTFIYRFNLTPASQVRKSGVVTDGQLMLFHFDEILSPFLRVRSQSNATSDYPLFFILRERQEQISWRLPTGEYDDEYQSRFSKTICAERKNIYMEISTESPSPLSFGFEFHQVDKDTLHINEKSIAEVRPQEPIYKQFTFPARLKIVWLKIFSEDQSCVRVTIEPFICPGRTYKRVSGRKMIQTMTTRAAIAIHEKHFHSFDVVFELASFEDPCWEAARPNFTVLNREELSKNITFYLERHNPEKYWALAWFFLIVVLLGMVILILCTVPSIRTLFQYPSKKPVILNPNAKPAKPQFVTGSFLFNLLIIAAFYTLPTVQLIFTYYRYTRRESDQDQCYYNFFCANPVGPFVAFNNLYSNIGYIFFGLFFIIIVRFHSRRFPWRYVEVFYAMGVALCLEGVLSAGYHICPTEKNFQFDTTFMYVIAGLCMYHLFQIRNPGDPGHPYKFYGIFALAVIFVVIGIVIQEQMGLQIFVAVVYVIISLGLGFLVMRVLYLRNVAAKEHKSCRVVMGGLQTFINILFIAYGTWALLMGPENFPGILLNMFIANLALFTVFYFAVKIASKELIVAGPIICSILALTSWAGSLYFYNVHVSNWQLTAAESRSLNKECIFLDFFDAHDVWHLASGFSLFLSFLLLLTLDDGQDICEDSGVVAAIVSITDPLIDQASGRAGPPTVDSTPGSERYFECNERLTAEPAQVHGDQVTPL